MALPDQCPLCGADAAEQNVLSRHVYGAPPHISCFRCGTCEVTYLHPVLTPEEKAQFYAEEFPAFMAGRAPDKGGWDESDEHVRANEPQRQRRMRYLERLLPAPGGRILDVGCASGFMLYPLAERGFHCAGVEPAERFADYVRGRGLPCFENWDALLGDPIGADGFDLIMHFFVLDHVAEPAAFLREQVAALRPGGRLVVEINSTDDAMLSVYGIDAFERFFYEVAQNYYFSYTSLGVLLDQVGAPYEILRDQHYGLSNHLTWALDGRPGGSGRFTDRLGAGIEDAYRAALVEAGTCDTLIGVVHKRAR